MAVRSRRAKSRRFDLLTYAEQMDLELGEPSAFASDVDRRAAWQLHRVDLIDGYIVWSGKHGRRPEAFWRFDVADPTLAAPAASVDLDGVFAAIEDLEWRRLTYLAARDLLDPSERATVAGDLRRRDAFLVGIAARRPGAGQATNGARNGTE